MIETGRTSATRAGALLAALVLLVAACAGGASPAPGSPSGAPPDASTTPGSSGSPSADGEDLTGQEVTVIGTWGGSEQEAFLAMVKPWEDRTGAKVKYTGTRDLNTVLTTGVASGVLPDLAGLPGPGQMAEWADSLVDLSTTCSTSTTYKSETAAPPRRPRHGRRQARRRLHQGRRQGPDLVQPEGPRSLASPPATWDELTRHDPRTTPPRPTPAGASGSSPGRPPAGRGPTGSRTSSSARPAPTSTTPGGRARRSGPTPRSSRPAQTFGEVVAASYGGVGHRRHDELRGRRRSALRDAAGMPVPSPGAASSPASAPSRPPLPAPTTTSSRSPTSTPSTPGRSRAPATCSGCSTTRRRLASLMAYLVTAEAQDIWVKIGGAHLGEQERVQLPGRHQPSARPSCSPTPRSSCSTPRT